MNGRVKLFSCILLVACLFSCEETPPERPEAYGSKFCVFSTMSAFPLHQAQDADNCAVAAAIMYVRVIISGYYKKITGYPDLDTMKKYVRRVTNNENDGSQGLTQDETLMLLKWFITYDTKEGRANPRPDDICAFGSSWDDPAGDPVLDGWYDPKFIFNRLSKSLDIKRRQTHFIQNYYHESRGAIISFERFPRKLENPSAGRGGHAVYAYGVSRSVSRPYVYASSVKVYIANPQYDKSESRWWLVMLPKDTYEDFKPRAVLYDEASDI